MKNVGHFFISKNIFMKNNFEKKYFQVDTTSSDLNEFWIGQKILEAHCLLFHLSTTFTGLFRR